MLIGCWLVLAISDVMSNSRLQAAPKDKLHAARESNGQASRSFTSTHLTPRTTNVAAIIDDDTVRYAKIKSKGYVRVTTNLGTMNLELRCDLVYGNFDVIF